jgi:hypothetical protein
MSAAQPLKLDASKLDPTIFKQIQAKIMAEQPPPKALYFPAGGDSRPREMNRDEFQKLVGSGQKVAFTSDSSSASMGLGGTVSEIKKPSTGSSRVISVPVTRTEEVKEAKQTSSLGIPLQVPIDAFSQDSQAILSQSVISSPSAPSQTRGPRRRPDGQESSGQKIAKLLQALVNEVQTLNLTLKQISEKLT